MKPSFDEFTHDMIDGRQLSRERLSLASLICFHAVICCLSLVYVSHFYSDFHVFYDPARLAGAVVVTIAAVLISCFFIFADFSFGYFVGFYLNTMILGYLWLNYFSDLNYDHRLGGVSAAASVVAFLAPALLIPTPTRSYALSTAAFERLLTLILPLAATIIAVAATYGFKFVSLVESLSTSDFSSALPNGLLTYAGGFFPPPAAVGTHDYISTQNRFYGPSIGLRLSGDYERITYSVSGRCGLGWVRQSQTTSGSTTFFADGVTPTSTTPGGMLIFPTNSGRIVRTEFAAVPELNLKLGYRLTRRVSVSIGYDLLYMSNAVRPGDAITQAINPSLLPSGTNFGVPFGPISPTPGISSSNFLLQAVSGGLSVVF